MSALWVIWHWWRPTWSLTAMGSKRKNGGSLKGSQTVTPRSRSGPSDRFKGKPGHNLASFLDAALKKREWSANDLFKAMRSHGFDKKDDDTVYKWVRGESTPRLNDLAILASALGYRDWFALVAAVRKHLGG